MTPPRIKAPVPSIALEPARAAAAIDTSENFFREHVMPHLAVYRESGKVLIPVSELERHVAERASPTINPTPKGSPTHA